MTLGGLLYWAIIVLIIAIVADCWDWAGSQGFHGQSYKSSS